MGIIKVLEEKVRLKIAAGEVVQNPASVVKELLENAIDAQSSRIELNIQKGGKRLIEVIDDGTGMSSDDAQIAFQRYSTSKISDIADLERIQSLGFRGEALASIAAVSQVELITKLKDATVGTRLIVKESKILKKENTERANGTTVRVQNLFFNVPARLKFLKTSTAEFQAILNIVTNYSLHYTAIHFILRHNNKEILNSPSVPTQLDKIFYIYGKEIAKAMVPLNYSTDLLKISGYMSKPSVRRGTRKFYTIFINNRLIKSKLIIDSIDDAYKTILPRNRHPLLVLSIDIDPRMIDVNVHPNKKEVKFSQGPFIYETLRKVILDTFDRENLIPEIKLKRKAQAQFNDKETIPTSIKHKPKQKKLLPHSETTPPITAQDSTLTEPGDSTKLPPLEIIGQSHNLFIIAADEQNLYLIDQHAAHERIMFEKFMKKLEKGGNQTQTLLSPIIIEFTISDTQILQSKLSILKEFGFEIEPFGKKTFRITKLPVIIGKTIKREEIELIIDELLELIDPASKKIPSRVELAQLYACKAAIKQGHKLSYKQMDSLYKELQNTENPYVCAHNRPSIILFSKDELERKFHR